MRLVCFVLAIGLFGLLVACTAPTTTAPTGQPPATGAAVASPTANYPVLVVPTPGLDTGVVTGRVVMRLTNDPMPGIMVYLGDRVPLEPGPGYTITHTQNSSPHISADADGNFAIAAPPGEYALIVWTPINAKVVADPLDGTKELVLVMVAGETTGLGDVVVDWP